MKRCAPTPKGGRIRVLNDRRSKALNTPALTDSTMPEGSACRITCPPRRSGLLKW
jgi:hypothetical protein